MANRFLDGEWWIYADGRSEYAESNGADTLGHEDIVVREVFGQYTRGVGAEYREDAWMDWHVPLTDWEQSTLREQGMPEATIAFFAKRNADARDYGVRYLGWIRVKDDSFEVWELDDHALERIQKFDAWPEGAEVVDGSVFIVEDGPAEGSIQSRPEWLVPLRVLFKAESAEALKRYMAPDGIGQWRENPTVASPELRALQAAYPGQAAYKVRSHGWLYPDGTVAELGPEAHLATMRRVFDIHTTGEMWDLMRKTKTIRVSAPTDFEVKAVPTYAQSEFLREQTRRYPAIYVEALVGHKNYYESFERGEEDQLDAWFARVFGDAHRENPVRGSDWWIEADGTVHDASLDGHELIAWEAILGFSMHDIPDDAPSFYAPLSEQAKAYWRSHGVPEKTILFLSSYNGDAREYIISEANWIRVTKNYNIQCHVFDDEVLQRIQRADIWSGSIGADTYWVEETSTHRFWESVSEKLLRTATSAEALIAHVEGIGRWRENPYPNEHAARQTPVSEKRYVTYRRKNGAFREGDGKVIDVVYGIRRVHGPRQGVTEVHSLRFRADQWTATEARAWLRQHGYRADHFEPATRG